MGDALFQKTTTEVDYAKLDISTIAAIQAFERVLKAERKLNKANDELQSWLPHIPSGELDAYVIATQKLVEKYEEK